ncbi:MAG: hypothetical protein HPY67_03160 [Syntrophaceae bacterium]|nr:hypothetical protein [Syntrophaceae bacterium]
MPITRESGFALIAAILANLMLLAAGIIALNLSTQDLRISTRIVGEKKAMSAAEAASHWLVLHFDPANPGASVRADRPLTELAAGLEPRGRVSITQPVPPAAGPMQISGPAGFDMASTPWVLVRYDTTVTGRSEDYRTSVTVDVGLGFGPVVAEGYR